MLSILSLNVKGLTSKSKQLCLQQFGQQHNSSIIFLQETNLTVNSPLVMPFDYTFIINPPVQPFSGVAIAFNKELFKETKIIQQLSPVPGYLQIVEVEIKNYNYHFINTYMPQSNTLAQTVLLKIHQHLQKIEEDSIAVIAGDWNVTLRKEDRRNCSELRTQLAENLNSLLQQHSLTDVWRDFNPNKLQFTFRGSHQNLPMARLDRFYMHNKNMHHVQNIVFTPSFSDHDGVVIKLNTLPKKFKTPYWKFDPTLLKSKDYSFYIKNLISFYQDKTQDHDCNICLLWDRLKEEISIASQRFNRKLKEETQEKLSTLLATLDYLDAKEELTKNDCKLMLQLRKEIATIYKSSASENLKYIESQVTQEANTSSKFFLRLAKQTKMSNNISQLIINGELTSEKNLIYSEVRNYFQNEFSGQNIPNQVDPSSIIYQDILSLSETDKQKCEETITQDEIWDSIKSAKLNKAPGLDGLPIEFYKFFWDDIKHIFTKLVEHFQLTGNLPTSMKKVVISPIPKPGDRNFLKNWRPISLINVDYKIVTRIYGKRMSAVLPFLLKSDQSYSVPGRTIFNNLHLLRNAIRQANKANSNLAVLALDQVGAFNRISHTYLEHLLKLHNFGPTFTNAISAFLHQTKAFVKVGSTLLAPFIFKSGILQGDPIAGPLYVLSIEPFLCTAMKFMSPNGFLIPNSNSKIQATAFADDIHFLVTQNEDFGKITEAFHHYSKQSGAQLNNQKTKGLFCGSWKNRQDKPLDCIWKNDGLKILGVYIGNSTHFEYENWRILLSKVKATLNQWSQYVKMTSLLGRKIVCNQLVGSQLIHTFNVLNPPQEFLQDVQKAMINFIWQGKHWLHHNFVHATTDLGGIGLTHMQAKVHSLRLKLTTDILNNLNSQEPVFLFHHYNLSLYGNCTAQHFFMKHQNYFQMANLDNFYASLLKAWLSIKPILETKLFSLKILREMPLTFSTIPDSKAINISSDWIKNGITKLGQLLNPEGNWIEPHFQEIPQAQKRRLITNFNLIKNYFQHKIDLNQDQDQIINFKFLVPLTNSLKTFPGTRKENYNACLQPFLLKPEITGKCTWLDKKISWNTTHNYPTDRKDSDVAWKLLHNALVTPRKLHQWRVITSSLCPWCKEEGNIQHMFFKCQQTKPLWNYISIKIAQINQTPLPNFEQLLIGFPGKTPAKNLTNFLLTLAKSTIYRTYMNVIKEENPEVPCYLKIFKLRLKYRLAIERNYAALTGTQTNFEKTFLVNNVLEQ